ncbi:MAG TPA: hypothetical protein VFG23_12300 [Polyangia bacterium]|nr:hypothetical protein [Polyangia bacterium]
MDQAPAESDQQSQASALSASWAAWEKYYKDASRRRRQRGSGHEMIREAKRRRLLRERLGLTISALAVGGLALVYYLVLN